MWRSASRFAAASWTSRLAGHWHEVAQHAFLYRLSDEAGLIVQRSANRPIEFLEFVATLVKIVL
jgi:hypothetical protein